ncbi:DUF3080 family protein [Alteromonas oceanisediminis]|uniref:DUF3080 family protein n=1 Tax=Alteromonas oceanisediminis TaxID=2836180 RepID=UPI001BDA8D1D|nr:DUF3080 family protein [Alteromonas oceanisediminis]MBT0587280.1 DUF3080 family protein [Alteromonas oceanisediminis]
MFSLCNLSTKTRPGLVAVLMIGLFGCAEHQQLPDTLDEYHERLERVLASDRHAPDSADEIASSMPKFPSKSSLFREPTALSVNVREFFALSECRLATLVAERNTGMGKMQHPSQRYVYERNLLSALSECADITEGLPVHTAIQQAIELKAEQISDSYANLIQTSDDIWLAFNQSSGYVSGDSSDGLQATRAALDYLLSHAPGSTDLPTSSELEANLQQLNQFRLPVRLWRSQRLLSQMFESSTPWLEGELKKLPCATASGEEKAVILGNVFRLFFANKIQPIASQLNHYHYRLAGNFETLATMPSLSNDWQSALVQRYINDHQHYKVAFREHIVVWQQFFERCGLSPNANVVKTF